MLAGGAPDSRPVVAGVGHVAGKGRGGGGVRGCQVDLALLVAHAPREVAVGGGHAHLQGEGAEGWEGKLGWQDSRLPAQQR